MAILNGRMVFVTGPKHCRWLSGSLVHPQLTADLSLAREVAASYGLFLETPQGGDPTTLVTCLRAASPS